MNIDLSSNTIIVNDLPFHLDSYRWYLLTYYTDLCTNLFIKQIVVLNEYGKFLRYSYDWDKIFELANENGYDKRFAVSYKDDFVVLLHDIYDGSGNLFKAGSIVPTEFYNTKVIIYAPH